MRLIDADNIRGCAKYIKVNEGFDPYIMIDDLVKLLHEQPIAYSVDKAIDDFAETLIPRLTDAIYPKDVEGMRNLINDVAEQLKAGKMNEMQK